MPNPYPVHSLESAPEPSRQALLGLKQRFGLVPNLAATMAESPTLVNNFVAALMGFGAGSFTGGERQVLLLTNAVTNRCAWAVAFHSTAALSEGVPVEAVAAVRDAKLPKDARLAALSRFTRALIETRGHAGGPELDAFIDAGFTKAQAFEVVAGLAVSTMANYAGNVAPPPLEKPFRAQEWAAR